jgi:hypothetical protein
MGISQGILNNLDPTFPTPKVSAPNGRRQQDDRRQQDGAATNGLSYCCSCALVCSSCGLLFTCSCLHLLVVCYSAVCSVSLLLYSSCLLFVTVLFVLVCLFLFVVCACCLLLFNCCLLLQILPGSVLYKIVVLGVCHPHWRQQFCQKNNRWYVMCMCSSFCTITAFQSCSQPLNRSALLGQFCCL